MHAAPRAHLRYRHPAAAAAVHPSSLAVAHWLPLPYFLCSTYDFMSQYPDVCLEVPLSIDQRLEQREQSHSQSLCVCLCSEKKHVPLFRVCQRMQPVCVCCCVRGTQRENEAFLHCDRLCPYPSPRLQSRSTKALPRTSCEAVRVSVPVPRERRLRVPQVSPFIAIRRRGAHTGTHTRSRGEAIREREREEVVGRTSCQRGTYLLPHFAWLLLMGYLMKRSDCMNCLTPGSASIRSTNACRFA